METLCHQLALAAVSQNGLRSTKNVVKNSVITQFLCIPLNAETAFLLHSVNVSYWFAMWFMLYEIF